MKTFLSWTLLGAGALGLGLLSTSGVDAWGVVCPLDGTDGAGRYQFQFHSASLGGALVTGTDEFPWYLVGDLPPAPANVNDRYALRDDETNEVYVLLGSVD